MESGPTSNPVRAGRLILAVSHVLLGVAMMGLVFPWARPALRARLTRAWSRRLLAVFRLELAVGGEPPSLADGNVLLVANHVSWLDIFVLNSVRPAHFVAKSEIRSWPVFGWLAEKAGTHFIERGKKQDTRRINHALAAALASGECVALFPEGGTSDGAALRPFRSSLLQAAVANQSRLWPAAIRYARADGSINSAAAYFDSMSLAESVRNILAQPFIRAEVVFAPPVPCAGRHRRELARAAEEAIACALGAPPPRIAPEKPAGLPAAAP